MIIPAEEVLQILRADYPAPIWYVPSILLAVLGYTSAVDARTGRIPDFPLAVAALGAFCSLAWFGGWVEAVQQLSLAITGVVVLRLASNIYFRLFRSDALGFGDAKWTGLAILGFGVVPVVIGWIVGAWIGIIWLAIKKAISQFSNEYNGTIYVHFAPFLFFGLLSALFRGPLLACLGIHY